MANFSYNFAGSGAIVADSVNVSGTVTAASLVGALTGNSTGTHTGIDYLAAVALDLIAHDRTDHDPGDGAPARYA